MSAETTAQQGESEGTDTSVSHSRLGFIQRFSSLFGFSSMPQTAPDRLFQGEDLPMAAFAPKCPACGVVLRWPESPESRKASCGKCGAKFSLPARPSDGVPALLKEIQDAYDYTREMEKELDDQYTKLSNQHTEAQDLRTRIGHVYRSLVANATQAKAGMSSKSATQLERIRKAYNDQKEQLIQQTARVMSLKEETVTLSRTITELTINVDDLAYLLDSARADMAEKDESIDQISEQNEALQEEIGRKSGEIGRLQAANSALQNELAVAVSEIQSLKEQLSSVRMTKKPTISRDVTIVEVASLWDVLPPGATERELKAYTRQIERRAHIRGWNIDYTRIEEILKLKPFEVLIPKKRARQVLDPAKHWFGYSVYRFRESDKVVLLCPVVGNAVYVLGDNWRKLIVKQKRQVRENFEGRRHAVHKGGTWLERVEADLRGRPYVDTSHSSGKPIRNAGGSKARAELQMAGRQLAFEIRATLREYSTSHSCYLENLGGHVLKHLGVTTRGEPRRQFCRKVTNMARTMAAKRDVKIHTAASGRERVKLR